MSDTICPACLNTGVRLLPIQDAYGEPTVDEFTCPCCRPWAHGFPGETVVINKQIHFVIDPSKPNEPAIYHGFPEL